MSGSSGIIFRASTGAAKMRRLVSLHAVSGLTVVAGTVDTSDRPDSRLKKQRPLWTDVRASPNVFMPNW
jgi:hypothetical protein